MQLYALLTSAINAGNFMLQPLNSRKELLGSHWAGGHQSYYEQGKSCMSYKFCLKRVLWYWQKRNEDSELRNLDVYTYWEMKQDNSPHLSHNLNITTKISLRENRASLSCMK